MDYRLLEILGRHLRYARPGEVDPDRKLRDLGLDSMRAIELLLDIEEEFDMIMPDELLNDETFATASSLWQAIQRMRSPAAPTVPRT